jgi:bifunctional non-homologous end joining protein LigD
MSPRGQNRNYCRNALNSCNAIHARRGDPSSVVRRNGVLASAVHCAFDLLELDGRDLRREPIKKRKELLTKLLRGSHVSLANECFEEDGAIVFREACKLGCEGIMSKRLGSLYRSGRSPHWVKVKNPKAPAVKREAEEDWGHSGAERRRSR